MTSIAGQILHADERECPALDSASGAAAFGDRIAASCCSGSICGLAVNTYGEMTVSELLPSLCAIVLAAMLSAGMTWAIRPLLLRHALAKPNARSSHRVPTPQGAGIAVMTATLLVASIVIAFGATAGINLPVLVFSATAFIALVGLADDV